MLGYRDLSKHRYPSSMGLSELAIRAAKPQAKPCKVYDEKGLFLLVRPSDARLWRFKYSQGGVEKLLALGSYPEIPRKRARAKRALLRSPHRLSKARAPGARHLRVQAVPGRQANRISLVSNNGRSRKQRSRAPCQSGGRLSSMKTTFGSGRVVKQTTRPSAR